MGNWTIEEKQFQEILETLHLWGINTFGELAALPLNGVSERLGQAGVKLQQLASGKNERHLKLVQPAPVFNNAVELEYPIVQLEPLSFIFARLLNQLCDALNAYALATNELRVILKLENQQSHERILNLPYPMRDNKVFLKLLLLDAEMHPPASAVIAISLSCEPVKPRLLQNGLFIPLAPEPEKLELTLARLNKLLGPGNVGSPELLDTHRPDAFRVGRFTLRDPPSHKHRHKSELQRLNDPRECALGFRMFRPPLRAMVETGRGCPKQISAWGKQLSVYGKIVRLAGPWRTTGDWWRSDNWAREEWDVAVETSCLGPRTNNKAPTAEALYRIYRELPNGAWFVEGSYD
jgi:protein ImuB